MQRLVLFRHAKAEVRSAGGEDFDRPLTPRGREDAAAMGALVVDLGLSPDLALVSKARRAQETWTSAQIAKPGVIVEIRESLYNATADEISRELDGVPADARTVMVVGHNPGLQELAVNLLIRDAGSALDVERLSSRFPTATLAVFQIDADGGASLEDLRYRRSGEID